jgi:hypothetical protein
MLYHLCSPVFRCGFPLWLRQAERRQHRSPQGKTKRCHSEVEQLRRELEANRATIESLQRQATTVPSCRKIASNASSPRPASGSKRLSGGQILTRTSRAMKA